VGRGEERRRRTQSPVDHHDTLVAPAGATRDEDPSLVLGRYRLHERLGAGGFGVVWRAHDELLHRDVAVKRISLPTAADRERASREALASARLAHPAIVALYEAGADEEAFYLISELVRGETFARRIAGEALCDEELLEVGVDLCDALAHAHARGVIHRDVKPQNVLLPDHPDRDAPAAAVVAKLTDFGGAQLAGEEALTRTGDVLGTLAYMAPEQSEGRGAGAEADLYSLALVLYEALSGTNPMRGPTPAATVRRIGRPLPPLERLRGDLPRALTRALDLALRPEPVERGTIAELRGALEEALTEGLRRPSRWRRPSRAPGPPELHAPTLETARAPEPRPDTAGWLTAQRLLWLAATVALCAWQAGAARPGVALLALAAALPLVLLVRRPGPRWLLAVLAPLLGMVGLAGAFPALAGQAARWRSRALLGALGYWWLTLAGPFLDAPGRRLWLGLPSAASVPGRLDEAGWHRYRALWEGSLAGAANHALVPVLGLGLLLGAALWALAAVLLPWVVRGRSVLPDALGAIAWAVALAASSPLLDSGADGGAGIGGGEPSPRGVILGAALGALLAVAARALRGRAGSHDH
jgi:hypothetical protein